MYQLFKKALYGKLKDKVLLESFLFLLLTIIHQQK